MGKPTPFPWQRSFYRPHPSRGRTDPETAARHQAEEALIMRGPGAVGSPSCNPVAYFNRPEDRDACVDALDRAAEIEKRLQEEEEDNARLKEDVSGAYLERDLAEERETVVTWKTRDLLAAVQMFLDAEDAVEAEAKRAEGNPLCWSSEPVLRRAQRTKELRTIMAENGGKRGA